MERKVIEKIVSLQGRSTDWKVSSLRCLECTRNSGRGPELEVCRGGCHWADKTCCHDQCVGGCDGPSDADCFACRHVFYGNRCVPRCPSDEFLVKNRRCVTEKQCRERTAETAGSADDGNRHYKPINGRCAINCPPGFEEPDDDPKNCVKCRGKCTKRKLFGS